MQFVSDQMFVHYSNRRKRFTCISIPYFVFCYMKISAINAYSALERLIRYEFEIRFFVSEIIVQGDGRKHGINNYKDTKSKCRHKKLPLQGLCGRCLSEFIDRRYSHAVMLVFSTQLCELLHF
jgi:hypothetical protein